MFDEAKAIKNVLGGDVRAFQLIVQQYERLVFSILNRMLTNSRDIEDVGQDIFVKVYNGLGKFNFQSKLSTWIARIAYNTAVNHLKKNAGKNYAEEPDDLETIHFTGDTPEVGMIKNELNAYVNKLVEQLPVQYKTVITLYHYNEFSYKEIQDITSLPEGTIKGYLFRARKLLKEQLEKYGAR